MPCDNVTQWNMKIAFNTHWKHSVKVSFLWWWCNDDDDELFRVWGRWRPSEEIEGGELLAGKCLVFVSEGGRQSQQCDEMDTFKTSDISSTWFWGTYMIYIYICYICGKGYLWLSDPWAWSLKGLWDITKTWWKLIVTSRMVWNCLIPQTITPRQQLQ